MPKTDFLLMLKIIYILNSDFLTIGYFRTKNATKTIKTEGGFYDSGTPDRKDFNIH